MSFEIITDTSSNIPLSLIKEKGLGIVPLSYHTPDGEHQCIDLEAFDARSYYSDISKGMKVITSQVTPNQYIELFTPLLDAGKDVLFVGMSSGISGSFSSACVAAQTLREDYPGRQIELVDTLSASLGEGLVALKAAELRDAGVSIKDTVSAMEDMSRRMCQVFTVNDLMHLRRGGRLSNISAIVGTVLSIKPLLKGDPKGKIVAFHKVRGRKNSISAIAQTYNEFVRNPEKQIVGIAHADCPEDAELLVSFLRETNPPKEILSVQYEPVTGAHVGPGALALFFLSDENVREVL